MPPFQSPNFTQVPNDFFDEYLPELNGSELKVLLAVIRGTFGYHRAEVEISTREMAEATGISSLATISQAAANLEEIGLIEKIIDGNKSLKWRAVVSDTKTVSQKKKSDTKTVSPVIQKVYQTDTENVSLLGLNKEKENKINDTFKSIIKEMENRGMYPNSRTPGMVQEWIEAHATEWIVKALDMSVGKGQNYADKILLGWESQGYPKPRSQQVAERKSAHPQQKQPSKPRAESL